MIKLLRNFPISLGVVSIMQLRILSIIVVKLVLDLFMLAILLKKFIRAFTSSIFVPLQVQYVCNEICGAFHHQVGFLCRVYKCVYLSKWIFIFQFK